MCASNVNLALITKHYYLYTLRLTSRVTLPNICRVIALEHNLVLFGCITGNEIGDDGVDAILEALKTEHGLEKLLLSSEFPMFCLYTTSKLSHCM